MGFLALNDQFFIPVKEMVQKIWNSRLFPYNSNYPLGFLQIFSYYNFGVNNIVTLSIAVFYLAVAPKL